MSTYEEECNKKSNSNPINKWKETESLKNLIILNTREQRSYDNMIKLGIKPLGLPPSHPGSWNPFYNK